MNGCLHLPPRYDLVVGDTFELFYKGIYYCLNSDVFDFELSFRSGKNLGKGFARKFVWQPTEADVGTHVLCVKVRSNIGEILDEGEVALCVHPVPPTPKKEKTVLVIGDSLTSGGVWVKEFHRRLTETGGTPAGFGIGNVRLIGSKGEGGALHEGYGGWTFTTFSTAYLNNRYLIITGDFSDKNNGEDQHSVYRDADGAEWKIEYVTPTEMKIICISAVAPALGEDGRLTHVSGGIHHADIVYTAVRQTPANPFWDADLLRDNFRAYAKRHGADSIDEVILFLGWNSTRVGLAAFRDAATTLIDAILAEFPACHISLVTLQVPSRDGFANNYGISWHWFYVLERVFAYQDLYYELAAEEKYRNNLSVISLAGQYDSAYNEIKMTSPVNTRNTTEETLGANGVHPSHAGYLQIADAILRHFCARLEE